MKKIQRLTLLLVLFFSACQEEANNTHDTTSGGKLIDSIRLTDLDNKPIDLNKLKGKTIFLNFWATWCRPCILEMPTIAQAQEKLGKENIVFLLASDETLEEIIDFKKANDYLFNYARAENSTALGILSLPTTYIFDRKGNLVFSEIGYRQWDRSPAIDTLIKIATQNE